jgi:hypothetical protein
MAQVGQDITWRGGGEYGLEGGGEEREGRRSEEGEVKNEWPSWRGEEGLEE